ncbi:DUF2812 domain-containing protein [Paenibacillus sp. GCM10027627]|uniref:DUF2812 domain-containing protein n=1 Tax=unclassified Paenibacillus TaxID=185978 RepID=UPI0036283F49
MSKDMRIISSMGLAFSEHREMRKLERLAARGWLLDSFAFAGYRVRRGKPQRLTYCVDYNHEAIKDMDNYIEMFSAGGWTKVCSTERIHIFSAPKGTRKIYTDDDTAVEKYRSAIKLMKPVLFLPIATLLLFALFAALKLTDGSETLQQWASAAGVLSLIPSLPIAMTYTMYAIRLNKASRRK